MHRNQKSQREKIPCHGTDKSQSTCVCAAVQQVQPAIQQLAPKATVGVQSISFLSTATYEVDLFDPGFALARFVPPPDQPPRQ